jgi:hypothetical protein
MYCHWPFEASRFRLPSTGKVSQTKFTAIDNRFLVVVDYTIDICSCRNVGLRVA